MVVKQMLFRMVVENQPFLNGKEEFVEKSLLWVCAIVLSLSLNNAQTMQMMVNMVFHLVVDKVYVLELDENKEA
jgi:hypothetical protein